MDIQNPYQHPSFTELLEIFPEAPAIILEISQERLEKWREEDELWEYNYYERKAEKATPYVRKKLKNLKTNLKWLQEFLKEQLQNYIRAIVRREDIPDTTKEIFIHVTNSRVDKAFIKPVEDEIKRLERIIRKHEWSQKPSPDGSITDLDIAHAKEFRITDIVAPSRAGFILCPFHSEKTGSCKIHKDNRYHCYSCGADGDVIDLVMKIYNLDFINAVKKILNK